VTNLGEAYVEVRADTSKFGPDLEKSVNKPLKDAEEQAKKLGDEIKGGFDKGAGSAAAFKKAAFPAAVAFTAVAGAATLFAKQAEEAEIAQRRLAQVLDTMGFGAATERVSEYADELERSVAVDGEVIKAAQAKLATFKNLTASVGETGGAFDRATLAALDLAAAGFGSAETNAVQLGKALQDPVKGLAALGRAGVTFTATEKEKIKVLMESGRVLEAQDLVLKAIEGQVGGTAAATASSFDRMKIAFENTGRKHRHTFAAGNWHYGYGA
jgi:phage-related minor tail protein